MNLRELQLRVLSSVMNPTPPDAELARTATDLVDIGARAPEAQLGTYREQYWLRHHGSLVEDFPTVRALLGEALFADAARAFLIAHPPTSPILGEASRAFSAFLGQAHDSLLEDAARLDFSVLDAQLADDASPVSAQRITAIGEADWPLAKLRLHPALKLLSLSAKLDIYRSALLAGAPIPIEHTPRFLAVERRVDGAVYFQEATETEFALLTLLQEGVALGAATERIKDPDPPLAEWFQRWMSRGWIVAIDLPEGPP